MSGRPRVEIPAGLEAQRELGADWGAWLDRLPALTGSVLDDWDLTVDGAPRHGYCSLVLPVRAVAYFGIEKSSVISDRLRRRPPAHRAAGD